MKQSTCKVFVVGSALREVMQVSVPYVRHFALYLLIVMATMLRSDTATLP
jgi:hypothetical protein